jgi:histidine ammonia-lyase
MTIMLGGSDLTVMAVARLGEAVALAPAARRAMRQSRAAVQEGPQTQEPVYGLTTGVAERKSFLLDPAQQQRFSQRLEPLLKLITRGHLAAAGRG